MGLNRFETICLSGEADSMNERMSSSINYARAKSRANQNSLLIVKELKMPSLMIEEDNKKATRAVA